MNICNINYMLNAFINTSVNTDLKFYKNIRFRFSYTIKFFYLFLDICINYVLNARVDKNEI